MEDFICESCGIQNNSDTETAGKQYDNREGEIVLYTTHCPKCSVLETKLNQKGIQFTTVDDLDEMIAKGFQAAPVLGVHGKMLEFGEAVKWVNNQGNNS